MNKNQVCGECKLFTNETSFGDGWCEFHKKYSFCENVACEDGEARGKGFSSRTCREYDAFYGCILGGENVAKKR